VANKRVVDVTSELSKLSDKRSAYMSKMKRHSLCDATEEDVPAKKTKLDEQCQNKGNNK